MKLTIFTPTYNRAHYLPVLFRSICDSYRQCDNNEYLVEWIIIDDGSNDDTERIVRSFEATPFFPIHYYKQNNGGKHRAFNKALDVATGDCFVCVDDDDPLTRNALPDIFRLMKTYEGKGYAGFAGRVIDENGNILGTTIFQDSLISNTIEIRDKYHFWGEPEVYYCTHLEQYRFMEYPGELFLTEAFLFDQLTVRYPLVYTNYVFQKKQYLKDGLTDNQLRNRIESPRGAECYYNQRYKLSKGFRNKLKAIINRQRFCYWIKSGKPRRKVNVYEIIARPISSVLFVYDILKYDTSRKQ